MSALGSLEQAINYRYVSCSSLLALSLIFSAAAHAESPELKSEIEAHEGQTIEELHEHAETIAVILETASERVEELSASSAETPMLLEAIRQEISLSRRWNRHLGAILREVTEARRALGEREREAAKEIARMTAVAEEASLELNALRSVLEGEQAKPADSWSDSSLDLDPGVAKQSQDAIAAPEPGLASGQADDALLFDSLADTRLELAFMQEAQTSALRDVESVRAKIFEALETLAIARTDKELKLREGSDLTNEDITSWAASMAAKLNAGGIRQVD
jgi:hypothetical protein